MEKNLIDKVMVNLDVKQRPLHRILVTYRALPISVMVFFGYLSSLTVQWVLAMSPEQVNMNHAALVGAVLTPVLGIFKFALDHCLDSKISNQTSPSE